MHVITLCLSTKPGQKLQIAVRLYCQTCASFQQALSNEPVCKDCIYYRIQEGSHVP